MLWRTHLRISIKVIQSLHVQLSHEAFQKLKEGVIAPDRWRDYPHHYGKSKAIKANVVYARKCFLQDDVVSACFYLGVALHYIQDSYTSLASFYPTHQSWEEDIEKSEFTEDVSRLIQQALKHKKHLRKSYLQVAEILSKEPNNKEDTLFAATLVGHQASKSFAKPVVDLNLAFRASFVVTKSVFGPKTCLQLNKKIEHLATNCEIMLQQSEVEMANKIIELIKKRHYMEKTKDIKKAGIIDRIKNVKTSFHCICITIQIKSKSKKYVQKKHLQTIADKHQAAINRLAKPHKDWYNLSIPKIDINKTRRILKIQNTPVSHKKSNEIFC